MRGLPKAETSLALREWKGDGKVSYDSRWHGIATKSDGSWESSILQPESTPPSQHSNIEAPSTRLGATARGCVILVQPYKRCTNLIIISH